MKQIDATVSYTVPENFDNAGSEISGNFQYVNIDSVADATSELGEVECRKLLQKAIKIQSANKARVKLMSENGHTSYTELSEEAKAKLKDTRRKNQNAIRVLQGLTSDKLDELGITF